ncbi:hypothetical protein SISNIDRAFT_399794, partial [Sistotremastrum niveocremeum HHB9708]
NLQTSAKAKYYAVRFFFVRNLVLDGQLELNHISGSDNPADMFTKPLDYDKMIKFRNMIGLEF